MLRETTSRGRCELVCPSRTGTREEPGTLIQGGALFSIPLVWESNPKLEGGWCNPTTSPSGDLIPTIRGSGAHPGRGKGCSVCTRPVCLLLQYLLQSLLLQYLYYKAVRLTNNFLVVTTEPTGRRPRPLHFFESNFFESPWILMHKNTTIETTNQSEKFQRLQIATFQVF